MVQAVCEIPRRLRERDDVSFLGCLALTGYLDAPDSLTVPSLVAELSRSPSLVEEWLNYSGDKRVTSGWAFERTRDGGAVIAWFPRGERITFGDPVRACAEFIVRELRDLHARMREAGR